MCRSWFVSQTAPTDLFKGDIVSDEHVVSKVDGSWTRGISFDNVCLCDFISAIASTKSEMSAGVQLPSDARVRPDLVALAGGNYDEAQIAKVHAHSGSSDATIAGAPHPGRGVQQCILARSLMLN